MSKTLNTYLHQTHPPLCVWGKGSSWSLQASCSPPVQGERPAQAQSLHVLPLDSA